MTAPFVVLRLDPACTTAVYNATINESNTKDTTSTISSTHECPQFFLGQ